ncbi:MAG: glycosyltransferase family 4 protein [Desulfobacteraceae bacterium]|jgi:colanic acid/amylovoran biosynthesis glycosyltransferase|nr:glycosyltransferase family 4 protein [Desulfobacteraceae bacterium]
MGKNRALRILIVGYGGGEITFLNRLVKGLADAGMQLTVTSQKRTNPLLLKHPNLQKLKTPAWGGFVLKRLFQLVGLFLTRFSFNRLGWLRMQVKKGKTSRERLLYLNRYLPFMRGEWDLVYFPWNGAAISYQGLYALGMPVVVSCRGSQVNIRPHLPGQGDFVVSLRKTLKEAAEVHCVSGDIQREAQKYGLDPEKSRIIQPAVDPDYFSPPKTKPENNRLILITTGSFVWSKSYEYLLLALKNLVQNGVNAELDILGDGPMRQQVLFGIQDMSLKGRIHLHGRLKPDQVVAHLQEADAFALASLSEGISNAVLEAMSCGLPVVTTDCGGMREAVTDGVEGFIVPLRDPQAMAEALAKLAKNPGLRERMGKAGRQRVMADFNLEGQVNAFVALFTKIS